MRPAGSAARASKLQNLVYLMRARPANRLPPFRRSASSALIAILRAQLSAAYNTLKNKANASIICLKGVDSLLCLDMVAPCAELT
jgi:hypothetical protein